MCPESGFRITPDRPQIAKMTMTLQFVDIKSSLFFDIVLFYLSSLVTGPSFVSISSLVSISSGVMTIYFYIELIRN